MKCFITSKFGDSSVFFHSARWFEETQSPIYDPNKSLNYLFVTKSQFSAASFCCFALNLGCFKGTVYSKILSVVLFVHQDCFGNIAVEMSVFLFNVSF